MDDNKAVRRLPIAVRFVVMFPARNTLKSVIESRVIASVIGCILSITIEMSCVLFDDLSILKTRQYTCLAVPLYPLISESMAETEANNKAHLVLFNDKLLNNNIISDFLFDFNLFQ